MKVLAISILLIAPLAYATEPANPSTVGKCTPPSNGYPSGSCKSLDEITVEACDPGNKCNGQDNYCHMNFIVTPQLRQAYCT
ncbi:hypothetical protein PTMSG1_10516 [Pyrenophora teres f. maculata]|nr:hypothetical protein PTMSG1_10516 [Pyrenophora teres f. maculata]